MNTITRKLLVTERKRQYFMRKSESKAIIADCNDDVIFVYIVKQMWTWFKKVRNLQTE